jgi:phage shock protein C
MIWGVCGGLAKYFNIDPTIVRILFVISIFFGTLGFWAYIIMTIIVPLEP